VPPTYPPRTDDDLARMDVLTALRDGLGTSGPASRVLFGDGAIAAAITADRLGVLPRSLTFLAEIVRCGGVAYAADLQEALPTPAQAALAHSWLGAACDLPEVDEAGARWLEAVATILEARRRREVVRADSPVS
jgi:hypothetical protein